MSRRHSVATSQEDRLVVDDRIAALMASWFGDLVARPWFDHVALRLLERWFFPLSRLWASARAANGSVDQFFFEVPMPPDEALRGRLEGALAQFELARAAVQRIEADWRLAFFGRDRAAGQRQRAAGLVQVEMDRRRARHRYNMLRRRFAFVGARHPVAPVRWETPTPRDVETLYARMLERPSRMYDLPDALPDVTVSRRVPGPAGPEFWIRFESPSERMGDNVVAHVYEPDGVSDPPTLIFGHGVCVEFDHWIGTVDEVSALCAMGVRVVRPESPWHGRRVPPGTYGGELFVARAPLGALDLFSAQVRELGVLADWCRRTSAGPVAFGGSSLGALVAQLAAVQARNWAERFRPDALFLVTHCGRLEEVALHGDLTRAFGLVRQTAEHGWTPELLRKWLPLTDPIDLPVVPPDNIVSVLGRRDGVTPFGDGRRLIEAWEVPAENAFITERGHFSVPVGLLHDRRPLQRLVEVLRGGG